MSNPTGDPTLGAYNIEDLRRIAQRRLPKGVFEFVDRGAEDEAALRNTARRSKRSSSIRARWSMSRNATSRSACSATN